MTAFSDPTFHITHVRTVDHHGQQHSEVAFGSDLDFGRRSKLRHGTILLDPAHHFILTGGKLAAVWPGSDEFGVIEIQTEIGRSADGRPYDKWYREHVRGSPLPAADDATTGDRTDRLAELVQDTKSWADDVVWEWTYHKLVIVQELPAATFQLSRYGLPEPRQKTRPRSLMLVAGNLILLCGLGVGVAGVPDSRKEGPGDRAPGLDAVE